MLAPVPVLPTSVTRWFTRCRSFAGALYGSPVGSTLVLKSGVHQWVGPWVAGCCRGIITFFRCVISYFGIAPSSRCIIIGWSWICYAVGAFLSIMSASSSTTICRVIVYRQCNRWVAGGTSSSSAGTTVSSVGGAAVIRQWPLGAGDGCTCGFVRRWSLDWTKKLYSETRSEGQARCC